MSRGIGSWKRRFTYLSCIILITISVFLILYNHIRPANIFLQPFARRSYIQQSLSSSSHALVTQTQLLTLSRPALLPVDNSDISPHPYVPNSTLLILYYNPVSRFLGPHWLRFPRCPKNCQFTEDKNLTSEAAGVIFHTPTGIGSIHSFRKRPGQFTISLNMESDCAFPMLSDEAQTADLEMTYRYSSHIWASYIDYDLVRRLHWPPKNKTKFACAFISNCHAHNNRLKYLSELMTLIPIDSYGKCLNNVERNVVHNPHNYTEKRIVTSQYKFYIAFENCNTDDYISEKIYHGLEAGSVPSIRFHLLEC
eukprot:TRINITY_DN2414_c0_g1_i2.p1 TRINITY_DN2414_c0_g1~~TRINITY_DN2414_c0_g1_i2.p1  ORF type:complete len:309 (+),score=11.61 TRINITY_DN2414_c0_g1_i2:155-1081(+)